MEKLTVNELFSGIGAQRKAFERLGIPHEVVGISEIDKYAIQSYEAIFGKTKNYGDICTAPRLDYADLWTYSFPCQDISVAGNQKGISEGTRSGLLYQVQRLLEVAKEEGTLPKYLLLENVKNLVGKKFKSQFDNWLFYLDQLGYDTYWQVLNAKNYGIPQNRERVFAVSIRKDLNQKYEFPKAETLTKKLADILEDEVDEKFYLSEKIVNRFKICNNLGSNIIGTTIGEECTRHGQRDYVYDSNQIIGALCASDYKQPKQIGICIGASRGRNPENPSDRTVGVPTEQRLEINSQGISNTITTVQKDNYVVEKLNTPLRLGNIYGRDRGTSFAGNVYDKNAISPTLNTMQGGNRQPMIIIGSTQKNAYVGDGSVSPTLTSAMGMGGGHVPMVGFDNIQKVDIPQIVKVRKYEIDNEKLVALLRSHKTLTNKQIAESLNVPLTKVEHWFRTDNSFAIPDAGIWYQLKELLGIETDEFDEVITTFEEKEGVYEKSNRCYLTTGIAPTLTSSSCDEKIIIDDTQGFDGVRTYENYAPTLRANRSGLKTTDGIRIRKLTPLECWRLMGFDDEDFYKAQQSGVSNTQLYKQAGNSIVVNVLEKIFKNL